MKVLTALEFTMFRKWTVGPQVFDAIIEHILNRFIST